MLRHHVEVAEHVSTHQIAITVSVSTTDGVGSTVTTVCISLFISVKVTTVKIRIFD